MKSTNFLLSVLPSLHLLPQRPLTRLLQVLRPLPLVLLNLFHVLDVLSLLQQLGALEISSRWACVLLGNVCLMFRRWMRSRTLGKEILGWEHRWKRLGGGKWRYQVLRRYVSDRLRVSQYTFVQPFVLVRVAEPAGQEALRLGKEKLL